MIKNFLSVSRNDLITSAFAALREIVEIFSDHHFTCFSRKRDEQMNKLTNAILPNKRISDQTLPFSHILRLESLLKHNMQNKPTSLGQTLQTIADLFNEKHIEFAVAGIR